MSNQVASNEIGLGPIELEERKTGGYRTVNQSGPDDDPQRHTCQQQRMCKKPMEHLAHFGALKQVRADLIIRVGRQDAPPNPAGAASFRFTRFQRQCDDDSVS